MRKAHQTESDRLQIKMASYYMTSGQPRHSTVTLSWTVWTNAAFVTSSASALSLFGFFQLCVHGIRPSKAIGWPSLQFSLHFLTSILVCPLLIRNSLLLLYLPDLSALLRL